MAKTKKPAAAAKKKPAAAAKKKAVPAPSKAAKATAKPAAKKKPAAAATKKPATKKPAAKKPAAKKPATKPATKKPKPASNTVDAYVAKQGKWQKNVIAELREILREGAPGATEAIKWGQPVYDWNGPFAHIKAFSKSVNLGFWRGATLQDPAGLLSGDDRMKYAKITGPDDVKHDAFVALVREAVRLNDELGDPTKR